MTAPLPNTAQGVIQRTAQSRVRWMFSALAFILMLGLAVLWYWPHWGLAKLTHKASQGRVQVLWVHGSLGHGQVQLGLYDGRTVQTLPGMWSWRVCVWSCPQPFAWGQVGVVLTHPTLGSGTGLAVYATPQGLHTEAGQVQVPAAWFAALGSPFNTLGPMGTLLLRWNQTLSWPQQDATTPVGLTLQWQQAALALSPVRPLGQWQLTALGTLQEGFTLALSSQQGPLFLTGQGQWSWQYGLNFAAYATPQAQSRAALQSLLQQVAQAEGERYRIRLFK